MADAAAEKVPGPLLNGLLVEPMNATGQSALENDDPALERIMGLVTKGAYAEAAGEAASLLSSGKHDLRIVGAYLFGSFVDLGMAAMPSLFRSIVATLTVNWASFGQQSKKLVFADGTLRWLLRTLLRSLEFHERAKDEVWRGWCEPKSIEAVNEALVLGPDVEGAIEATLPAAQGGCLDLFRRLSAWLSEHERANAPVPEEAPGDESDAAPEAASHTGHAGETATAAGRSRLASVPLSTAMAELLRKLEAFQTLIGRGDFMKAGVIAADILAIVERFDPRVYLPAVFSSFFMGLSRHVEALEPWLQTSETLSFKSLEQLYRVDLDAFMRAGGKSGE